MSAIAMPQQPPAPATPPPVGGPRPWRCTRAQYAQLGAAGFFTEKRYQLIRGEIIDMGKEGPRHFTMVGVAVEVFRAAFGAGFYIRQAGPIGFEDSEPEPDVAVVPGSIRDYIADHPATALLAVEVAETSLAYDTTTKAELYATAGIPEYWVVDLEGRRLLVYRDPAPLAAVLDASAYGTQLVYTAGDAVTPLHAAHAVNVGDLLP